MTLKLLPILALGAVLAAQPMQAQTKFGVVVGVVSTNVSVTGESNDPLLGFAGGVTLAMPLASNFSFAPEALYIQKGDKFTLGSVESKFKIAYIEVPVLFRYTFGVEAKAIRPYVTAGPTVAFKLSCKFSGASNGTCEDEGSHVKSSDFGVMAGLGFQANRIGVSARYEAGLANINDDSNDATKAKNKMWMFMVSFTP